MITSSAWTAFKDTLLKKDRSRDKSDGKRVRRRKQLPDDFKVTRGWRKLEDKALDYTQWRTRIERGYGALVWNDDDDDDDNDDDDKNMRKKIHISMN